MLDPANHPLSDTVKAPFPPAPISRVEDVFESVIFNSRLLLLPMYVLLAAAMVLYDISFTREFWALCHDFWGHESDVLMLGVIGLTDMTMVANLIVMTTIGGLSVFVREIDVTKIDSLPRWMKSLTSGMLKVKMGSSLIGITAVHLLQASVSHDLTWDKLWKLITIHLVFVVSAYAFARIEAITHPVPTAPANH